MLHLVAQGRYILWPKAQTVVAQGRYILWPKACLDVTSCGPRPLHLVAQGSNRCGPRPLHLVAQGSASGSRVLALGFWL